MTERTTIELLVKPRSRRDGIEVLPGGRLAVRVTSPPVDGRANTHLVRLLAEKLGVPRSALEIVRGEGSRYKVVAVRGLGSVEAVKRLAG